jgi:hypothetical protein
LFRIPDLLSGSNWVGVDNVANSAGNPSPVFFDDPAFVLSNLWLCEPLAMRLQPLMRALLIRSHQPRVGSVANW